jgi:hypothetical protein
VRIRTSSLKVLTDGIPAEGACPTPMQRPQTGSSILAPAATKSW